MPSNLPNEVRRKRERKPSLNIDREKIFQRVYDFYLDDRASRDIDIEQRLQRYAKYRLWTDGGGGPWPGSSDVSLSDMMEKSFRVQDTLHNAVMSQRPPIVSEAVQKVNSGKEDVINALLDYQFFEEANGENIVGDLAEAFINDGVFTAFIPWVREVRRQSRVEIFPAIPPDQLPSDYFKGLLQAILTRDITITPSDKADDPWDFHIEEIKQDEDGSTHATKAVVHFYTKEDGRVEMVLKGDIVIYDGPLPMVMDYDDVFHPPQAANLQPPGPANPGGAAHVILRNFPTKDEITRLQKSKFYDLMTKDDIEALANYARSIQGDDDREETQRDDLGGKVAPPTTHDKAKSHDTLTRLICFDRYDIDGDGLDEDVIWWVILETKQLVKARVLQEVYPTLKPTRPRPFAEASLFPVRGRRVGISLLEMMEGLHDAMKTLLDQTIDANTMGIVPFGFYRPTSSMQSEVLRLGPGELFPLADPSRDVNYPQIGNPQAQGMAINLFTILAQQEEKVTVIGDFQLGRVPAGKSTALRTTGGMQLLAGQGEARPERILRRFFGGLAQIFSIMHDLNQYFLPKMKQIRIQGVSKPGTDPYLDVPSSAVRGEYQFKFRANAMNTSKQILQQTLQTLMSTYVSQIAIQLGISTPETIYNLLRDFGKALGSDPEASRYINPPTPGVGGPRLFAEEAMALMLQDQVPTGMPAEQGGWLEHLQKLGEIVQQLMAEDVDTGQITPEQGQLIQGYLATVKQRAAEEQQQQQIQAAAQQFAQQQGGGGPTGRPPENAPPNPNQNPRLSSGNELIDESLPTAGGGGQPA